MTAAVRWEKLSREQRKTWIEVIGALVDCRRLSRRAEAALDAAIDHDVGKMPAHITRALERAIVEARELLGV
jgi:hypothetical protein